MKKAKRSFVRWQLSVIPFFEKRIYHLIPPPKKGFFVKIQ